MPPTLGERVGGRKRKDLTMNDFRCRFVDQGVGGSVILAEY